MLFTSFSYLVFLPIITALYWLCPKKARLPLLLLASYYFYMSWIPAFALLILGMTLFNYYWGQRLSNSKNAKTDLTLGIGINLACLFFFKYTNFLLDTFNWAWLGFAHTSLGWHADIILPLGISFFAFEFVHYLFEIYRGNSPINSFVLFGLFAAFFPTQIAGPIKRYKDFESQMQTERKFSLSYFDEGVPLIILGLAKKLLLADTLAVFVQMIATDPKAYSGPELWLFAYAFAFQIYFDFSGYTDIGRGSAMLLGYHIPINFNVPYIAKNISEFWHRWHISLSTWLRDYLFIPMGGSRGSRWSTNRNLFLTMALGGLWHGASWNFVVWGIFHGIALIVQREFQRVKEAIPALKAFVDSKLGSFLSIIFTFHAVCIGWVFFRMQDINLAFFIVRKMLVPGQLHVLFESTPLTVLNPHLPVIVPIALILIAGLVVTNIPLGFIMDRRLLTRCPVMLRAAFSVLLLVTMIILQPDNKEPFIYFQF